jgi:hypothetical protein
LSPTTDPVNASLWKNQKKIYSSVAMRSRPSADQGGGKRRSDAVILGGGALRDGGLVGVEGLAHLGADNVALGGYSRPTSLGQMLPLLLR